MAEHRAQRAQASGSQLAISIWHKNSPPPIPISLELQILRRREEFSTPIVQPILIHYPPKLHFKNHRILCMCLSLNLYRTLLSCLHHLPPEFHYLPTMAICGSLTSLFENPLQESSRTLFDSLASWNQIKPRKPIDAAHLTEIFGELNFEERLDEQSKPVNSADEKKESNGDSASLDLPNNPFTCDGKGDGSIFAVKNSESLQLCTEGLGSESSDDLDDFMEPGSDWNSGCKKEMVSTRRRSASNVMNGSSRRSRNFPPPIPSIGRSGRPWICLRSYRHDGRFVLKEVRIPCQELLHTSREDGRLKLQFVHPEEIISEEEEEDEQENEAEEGDGGVEEEGQRGMTDNGCCH